jgi:hypothetical protein
MRPTTFLTDARILAAKPTDRPYKLTAGGSAYIEILPNGGKYWRFKYRFGGKQTSMSLGVYPKVSIEEAMALRDKAKAMLKQGENPGELARLERACIRDEQVRQEAATRFMLDNDGALSFRLGRRCLTLTPSETSELRAFLDATKAVQPKEVTPCR